LKKRKMTLTDVLSIPDIDPGVLRDRDIDLNDAVSVAAKSGYVNRHHALAGVVNTKSGPVYFGIFATYSTSKQNKITKAMVDKFLNTILDNYRPVLRAYNYIPNENIFSNILIRKV